MTSHSTQHKQVLQNIILLHLQANFLPKIPFGSIFPETETASKEESDKEASEEILKPIPSCNHAFSLIQLQFCSNCKHVHTFSCEAVEHLPLGNKPEPKKLEKIKVLFHFELPIE